MARGAAVKPKCGSAPSTTLSMSAAGSVAASSTAEMKACIWGLVTAGGVAAVRAEVGVGAATVGGAAVAAITAGAEGAAAVAAAALGAGVAVVVPEPSPLGGVIMYDGMGSPRFSNSIMQVRYAAALHRGKRGLA